MTNPEPMTPDEAILAGPAGIGDEADDEAREVWRIEDEGGADWALRKLRKIETERDNAVALADDERARIAEWQEHRTGELEHEAEFFRAKLAEYHRGILADDPKRTGLTFPAGALRSTAGRERVIIDDDAALVAWLTEDDERAEAVLTYADPKADKHKLKERIAATAELGEGGRSEAVEPETGEKVPGVYIELGHRSFTAKPAPTGSPEPEEER